MQNLRNFRTIRISLDKQMDLDALYAGNAFAFPGRQGQMFFFKAIDPSDKEKIRQGFAMLSAKSVYSRFFTYLKELTEQQLDELVNADQYRHVVWGAFDLLNGEPFGVGIGRYVRDSEKPDSAEMAITIVDKYHSQGIGTIMLAILYHLARRSGIRHLTGIALGINMPLLLRFQAMGGAIERSGHEYLIDLPVFEKTSMLPDTTYATIIAPIIDFLDQHPLCT